MLNGIGNNGLVIPCHIFLPVKHCFLFYKVQIGQVHHHAAVDLRGKFIQNNT